MPMRSPSVVPWRAVAQWIELHNPFWFFLIRIGQVFCVDEQVQRHSSEAAFA